MLRRSFIPSFLHPRGGLGPPVPCTLKALTLIAFNFMSLAADGADKPRGTLGQASVLEVDPGTGAATLRIPLGPGVGGSGVRYVPALLGRFAPHGGPGPAPSAASGFELSPGHLHCRWDCGEAGAKVLSARWTLPDGTGGGTGGAAPQADPRDLLAPFGYGPDAACGPAVGGLAGDLLLPLAGSGPGGFLVLRAGRAFEYRPDPSGAHHFRITEVRDTEGGRLTFTYGPSRVDFEAASEAAKVRVVLAGRAPAAPVPALDGPGQDPDTPSLAFLDTEARIRVTYEGPAPGSFSLTAMARPGEAGPGGIAPEFFRGALQVTGVLDESTGETLRLGYGRAPALERPGPLGTRSFAPTVLTDFASDQRALHLEWEGAPVQDLSGQESGWRLAARGVQELGDGAKGPVRHFRHFALGAGAPVPCRTLVRDRWNLGKEPGGSEGPIPTFELDEGTGILVAVPGHLTRWICQGPGDPGDPPDLHDLGRPGLRGGAARQPYFKWPGGISYDPIKREATMEVFSAPVPPLGASGRVPQPGEALFHGPGLMAHEIAKNALEIQQTSQRTAALIGPPMPPPPSIADMVKTQSDLQQARMDEMFRNQQRAQLAAIEKAKEEHLRQVQEVMAPPSPATPPTHPTNLEMIEFLRPISSSMAGKAGSALVLIWDWKGLGVIGENHSVGHAALAIKGSDDQWRIIQSQFPHEPGGASKPHGPNILIFRPHRVFLEEGGRKPDSAFRVEVPDLGGLAGAAIADLEKNHWFLDPGYLGNSTNCTHGIIQSLRAGGVPLSSMWANHTLIIPGTPYTPRDLRTALARDADFNVLHPYKIYHQNNLIDEIDWEK